MKKLTIMTLIAATLICAGANIVNAADKTSAQHSWYIMRVPDNKQPAAEPEMRFIENYNGFYIDKKATDDDKVLYLTFDAGYENGNVAKILDVLKNKEVPGAFFILKNLIERNPELVKRMADEGHMVCNHTMSHKNMAKFSDKDAFAKELDGLADLYAERIGGEMCHYYRPPEGTFSELNMQFANELGYETIFWSFAYADWDNNKQPSPASAKEKILANTHNGAVILLHPTSSTNAAILGELIDEWKAKGYRFGDLGELTGDEAGS